jgi:hypothetical protein
MGSFWGNQLPRRRYELDFERQLLWVRCYDDLQMKAARFGQALLTLVCLLLLSTSETAAQVTAITVKDGKIWRMPQAASHIARQNTR